MQSTNTPQGVVDEALLKDALNEVLGEGAEGLVYAHDTPKADEMRAAEAASSTEGEPQGLPAEYQLLAAPKTPDELIAMVTAQVADLLKPGESTGLDTMRMSGLAVLWKQNQHLVQNESAMRLTQVRQDLTAANTPLELYVVQRMLFDQLRMCAALPEGGTQAFIDGITITRLDEGVNGGAYLNIVTTWAVFIPDEIIPPEAIAASLETELAAGSEPV